MGQGLKLHPDSSCAAVTRIDAEAARPRPGALALRYVLTGRVSGLRIPPLGAPQRTDELWRRTCFEAFVRAPGGDAYYELNFAPSTQWAAYRFTGYRSGMTIAGGIGAPRIDLRSDGDRFTLEALLDLDALTDLPADGPWRLGLSAVIEESDGRISYWALAHPPGRADFHHADCFALEVRAPERP